MTMGMSMTQFIMFLLTGIYIFSAVAVLLYGWNCYVMIWLFVRKKKEAQQYRQEIYTSYGPEKLAQLSLPKVTKIGIAHV